MRKYNKARDTIMHHKVFKVLKQIANSTVMSHVLRQRTNIILASIFGSLDREIGKRFGVSRNVVSRWRRRFIDALPVLNRIAQKKPEVLAANIVTVLSDNPRSGRPAVFDAVCRSFIIGIACNNPGDYGFVRSHWSLPVLQKAIINKRIVSAISCSTINRILNEVELKPHKNRY